MQNEIANVDENTDTTGELFVEHSLTVNKSAIELWWPNGYGRQKLYNLYVKWEDNVINSIKIHDRETMIDEKVIRVGFRNIKLSQERTSDGLMFYFIVNDVPMFMKGSNWIPSSVLPESSYDENYGK